MSILKLIVPALICTYALSASSAYALDRKDIVIRDPYILYEAATCTFYMYGTITRDGQLGFDVYETKDPTLQTWNDPKPVFRRPEGFWGDRDYWARHIWICGSSKGHTNTGIGFSRRTIYYSQP